MAQSVHEYFVVYEYFSPISVGDTITIILVSFAGHSRPKDFISLCIHVTSEFVNLFFL